MNFDSLFLTGLFCGDY